MNSELVAVLLTAVSLAAVVVVWLGFPAVWARWREAYGFAAWPHRRSP